MQTRLPRCVQMHSVLLPNLEGLPEHEHVADPARQVTLFKAASHHVDADLVGKHYAAVAHGNPNYCLAYSGGKSIARVLPGLRSHGAHHWLSYNGTHNYYIHPQSGILHYTYNRHAPPSPPLPHPSSRT